MTRKITTNDRVWLIGGTGDSAIVAKALASKKIPHIVSVATKAAKSLYSDRLPVKIGSMNSEQMQCFCLQENIQGIVDASHPYAVEVSRQAIAIAKELDLPYIRYERESYRGEDSQTAVNSPSIELDSFDTLVGGNYLQDRTVLLTIGCKQLIKFSPWQDRATLYARILPKTESVAMALAAGFTSDRLIAIRPPITMTLEKALWQQWQISLVVTKASGKAGGEDIKRQLAADLNIPLIVIARPPVDYPQQTSNFSAVISFCQNLQI